jgi:hypothetical protein
VNTENGKELADKLGLPFKEVSALKGNNINETFDYIF